MSIRLLTAQMILAEHLYRPITGTVVTLGRHSVSFNSAQMDRLMASMGVKKRDGFEYAEDQDTVGQGQGRITQESFFGAFSDARVISLDVSDYEKAEIICDIQKKLPWRWRRKADFVYDGGSLDNIFDVAATLKNLSRLLKPGGRFLASNNGGPHPTSYLKFSADWFMDFFSINRYADCKTYIIDHPNTLGKPHLGEKPKIPKRSPYSNIVYSFNPYITHSPGGGYDCSSVELQNRYQIFVFAEKAEVSTDDLNPIQKHYRVDAVHNRICHQSAKRFLDATRPVFSNPVPFDPEKIPRIDSSDYPEQLRPVAVITREYVSEIMNGSKQKES